MYRAQNLRPGADHNVISNCSGGLIRPLCHCDLLKDGYILSKTGVVGNNDPIQMVEQDRRRGKLRPRAQIRSHRGIGKRVRPLDAVQIPQAGQLALSGLRINHLSPHPPIGFVVIMLHKSHGLAHKPILFIDVHGQYLPVSKAHKPAKDPAP